VASHKNLGQFEASIVVWSFSSEEASDMGLADAVLSTTPHGVVDLNLERD
jgi:hypothetical protein